jgi:hypothetical protein
MDVDYAPLLFFCGAGWDNSRGDYTNDDNNDMTRVGAEAPLSFLPGKCQVVMETERVKKL